MLRYAELNRFWVGGTRARAVYDSIVSGSECVLKIFEQKAKSRGMRLHQLLQRLHCKVKSVLVWKEGSNNNNLYNSTYWIFSQIEYGNTANLIRFRCILKWHVWWQQMFETLGVFGNIYTRHGKIGCLVWHLFFFNNYSHTRHGNDWVSGGTNQTKKALGVWWNIFFFYK